MALKRSDFDTTEAVKLTKAEEYEIQADAHIRDVAKRYFAKVTRQGNVYILQYDITGKGSVIVQDIIEGLPDSWLRIKTSSSCKLYIEVLK